MLMKVKNEKVIGSIHCDDFDWDKPSKYLDERERSVWEDLNYRIVSQDCDTKRTGFCKITQNIQAQTASK